MNIVTYSNAWMLICSTPSLLLVPPNLKYARWYFALVRPGRMLGSYHSQFRFEIVFNPDKGN